VSSNSVEAGFQLRPTLQISGGGLHSMASEVLAEEFEVRLPIKDNWSYIDGFIFPGARINL